MRDPVRGADTPAIAEAVDEAYANAARAFTIGSAIGKVIGWLFWVVVVVVLSAIVTAVAHELWRVDAIVWRLT